MRSARRRRVSVQGVAGRAGPQHRPEDVVSSRDDAYLAVATRSLSCSSTVREADSSRPVTAPMSARRSALGFFAFASRIRAHSGERESESRCPVTTVRTKSCRARRDAARCCDDQAGDVCWSMSKCGSDRDACCTACARSIARLRQSVSAGNLTAKEAREREGTRSTRCDGKGQVAGRSEVYHATRSAV